MTYQYDQSGGLDRILNNNIEIAKYVTDPAGRLESDVRSETEFERRYHWDGDGRLAKITITNNGNSQESSYLYDHSGLRISKAANGITTRYLWGADGLVEEGSLLYERVNGIVTGIGGERIVYDGLGSVAGRIVAGGLNTYRIDAWGGFRNGTGPGLEDPSLGFAGMHAEAGAGLSYAQQRWYDDRTGRFLSEDKVFGDLGNPMSLHRWGYANGNPGRYTDPIGEAACMMGKDPTECVRLFNMAKFAAGNVPHYDPSTMVQGTGGTFLNPSELGGYDALVLMGDVIPSNMSEADVPTGVMGVEEAAGLLIGIDGAGIAQGEQVQRLATFFEQIWGGMSFEGIVSGDQQAFAEGVSVLGGFSPLALVGITPQMRDWNNPATFGPSNDLRKLLPQPGDFTAVGGSERDYAEWSGNAELLNGARPGMYMLGLLGGAIATSATLLQAEKPALSYSIRNEMQQEATATAASASLWKDLLPGVQVRKFGNWCCVSRWLPRFVPGSLPQ